MYLPREVDHRFALELFSAGDFILSGLEQSNYPGFSAYWI